MASDNHSDRELWNERYRTGEYRHEGDPAAILTNAVGWLPAGRALDVATGTGRHALFLAERGYAVDAIDLSEEGLAIAQQKADGRGVEVNWIQADLDTFAIPRDTYAVICVIGYYDMDLLETLPKALVRGGILIYEHHLGPAAIADRGPQTDEFRARSNEVLRASLELTVLEYREWSKTDDANSDSREIDPRVSLIARKGVVGDPWYPPVPP